MIQQGAPDGADLRESPRRGDDGKRNRGPRAFLGWLRGALADAERRRAILGALAVALVCGRALQVLLGPFFEDLSLYGFHDWDAHSAYRYITVVSLLKYREMPYWHPWFSGGYPAWAFPEGATNLVSPWLPAYLFAPIQVAERIEVLGSAIVGLASTYLLAGRFTKSSALRGFVAIIYGINGRWALQISTGHTWHLQYAWLPLALYFYLRAQEPGKARHTLWAGMTVAMMVYMGGIYPLPHTVLALAVFMVTLCAANRSLRPVWTLALTGFSGLGLSALKLFPMVEFMLRNPRLVDSPESLDLRQLIAMMTDPMQAYGQAPIAIGPWGWHEFGIYVGLPAFVALILGALFATGRHSIAPRIAGILFMVLGLGAFHPNAPWPLLHKVPPFMSQHVPSRFLHTGVLLLGIAFATFVGRFLDKRVKGRAWLDVLLVVPLYFVAVDIAAVGRKSTEHVFYMRAPPVPVSPEFHHEKQQIYNYTPGDWGGANLLAMFANTGTISCYGVPIDPAQLGAIAKGDPRYKGEAYFAAGAGHATVVKWTPNSAVVEYADAGPDAVLVYNMNWDPNWQADGKPAWNQGNAVGAPVAAGSGRVTFRYRPRWMNGGIAVFALTLAAAFGGPLAWRRLRRRAAASPPKAE